MCRHRNLALSSGDAGVSSGEEGTTCELTLCCSWTTQAESTRFFGAVLAQEPALDVPGMSEFTLGQDCILGLMPAAGIKRLLGRPDVGVTGECAAELYLHAEDPQSFMIAHWQPARTS